MVEELTYKYDVAFSLCQQDADYAKKINSLINPSLRTFLYLDNQRELITENGIEKFGKVFKEEARIVVLLSRKEWGISLYTGIEKDAIYDRPLKNVGGFNFLFIIPMVPGEIPEWYPSSRIYADPQKFSAEEIAKFIEFKIVENGGEVKLITFEDKYRHFAAKVEGKKELIGFQKLKIALDEINVQLQSLYDCFSQKCKILNNTPYFPIGHFPGNPSTQNTTYFQIEDLILELTLLKPDEERYRIVSTQDYSIQLELYRIIPASVNNPKQKKQINIVTYKFLFSEKITGWCKLETIENPVSIEQTILFRCRNFNDRTALRLLYYDLKSPISTENLIDSWFQLLFDCAAKSLDKFIGGH